MLLLIAVNTVLLVQYVHGAVHVHDGVPVRSVPGVLQVEADGLVHWSNGLLDVARTPNDDLVEGGDITLACILPQQYINCRFTSPLGEVYYVDENSVTDGNGNDVPNVYPWAGNDGVRSCGIVATFNSSEENWKCSLGPGPTYINGYISTAEEVTTGLRLPTDVTPLSYDLFLEASDSTFDDNGDAPIYFDGLVEIEIVSTTSKPCIQLHADEMTVLDVLVLLEGTELPLTEIGMDFQRTFFEVCVENGFTADLTYKLILIFEVDTLRTSYYQYGFYYKPCTAGDSKVCWFTQGEATNARNIFPCFDEPALKANIRVQVVRLDGYSTLSNMPLITSVDEDGMIIDVFQNSEKMSVYLFALAITDFVSTNITQDVAVWSSLEDKLEGRADYSADIGPRVLDFYGEYFGVEYSLPKMDLVVEEQKDLVAMENWGLNLYDPSALLVHPDQVKPGLSEERWLVSSVVAHELAHQWFGNLVTLDWWEQMWLNEGFATYVSYLAAEDIDPDNLPWGRLLVEETFRVLRSDSDTTLHWAMTDPVTSRDDIERKFGQFTYQKGGSVIRMMEGILGKEVLTMGLSSYLKANAYGSTTEDDLFSHLESAGVSAGVWPGTYQGSGTFGDIMKSWTNQAGYPLVTAVTECPEGLDGSCQLRLSQEWFVTKGDTNGEKRMFDIPITVNVLDSSLPVAWLSDSEMVLELPLEKYNSSSSNPIIINNEATGYYRVNYDDNNWFKIAAAVMDNIDLIRPFNRVQIICDLVALEGSGHVSSDLHDDITGNWEDDDQVVIWATEQCGTNYKNSKPLRRI
ncbi:puromycin-sensitive aminopeptidase-like protein isoform X2 [Eurytemora carolleeae]|uniref:puromycin-sensitive aminopeptidase-like protein isoform X2 n=1 Tax=Eurytemora carolleeae TaxID=1294199 RepID=UPI000C77AB7B|nr:puromycin-sensitive aminopeptidase-like protein isoform X2 [Eurytemora carolleeae]|eukprot:XP_023340452.1 puromycin-sensitive aminopeptidase-like protein isoform X2 [Eurytemora affinis]